MRGSQGEGAPEDASSHGTHEHGARVGDVGIAVSTVSISTTGSLIVAVCCVLRLLPMVSVSVSLEL
jgi:hypothetical protein